MRWLLSAGEPGLCGKQGNYTASENLYGSPHRIIKTGPWDIDNWQYHPGYENSDVPKESEVFIRKYDLIIVIEKETLGKLLTFAPLTRFLEVH